MNTNTLTFLFSSFSTKFRDTFEKHLSEIDLHTGQVFVLLSLWENDGQSQADLVKGLNLSAPTIYNMVIKLSKMNFVEIRKDDYDARIMRVFLTQKGYKIKPHVESELQKVEGKVFGILTETEIMMTSLLIKKLLDNLLFSKN